jgi:hypothetical protein
MEDFKEAHEKEAGCIGGPGAAPVPTLLRFCAVFRGFPLRVHSSSLVASLAER